MEQRFRALREFLLSWQKEPKPFSPDAIRRGYAASVPRASRSTGHASQTRCAQTWAALRPRRPAMLGSLYGSEDQHQHQQQEQRRQPRQRQQPRPDSARFWSWLACCWPPANHPTKRMPKAERQPRMPVNARSRDSSARTASMPCSSMASHS